MRFLMGILLMVVGFEGFAQNSGIKGKVTSGGEPVPFANLYIEGLTLGTTSNENGVYHLSNIPGGKNILMVSAVGYTTVRREIMLNAGGEIYLDIQLEVASNILDEVLIVDSQTGLSRRTPYNISTIQMSGIENKGNPNGMMGVLREVPGVYGAEFGHGIVKPFIRGLGFSRIVTIYQGNKLENHQWGADHGLGIQ